MPTVINHSNQPASTRPDTAATIGFPATLGGNLLPGTVALIGAGPGDLSLLTLRAWSLLRQADVVVYDRLLNPQILSLLPPACSCHFVGKSKGQHSMPQAAINQLLSDLAQQQLRVVRLKGGDPMIFGRGGEEVLHLLQQRIACQIVPGISAASGCATYAGIPLTHRGVAQSCQLITGHMQQDASLDLPWQSYTAEGQTLVFYMGLTGLTEIVKQLIKAGLAATTPAALISNGTRSEQRISRGRLETLPQIAQEQQFEPPTLIIIGHVVELFSQYSLSHPATLCITD